MEPGWLRTLAIVGFLGACGGSGDGDFAVTCHVATRADAERGQPAEAPAVVLEPGEPVEVAGEGGMTWRGLDSSEPGEGRAVSVQVVGDDGEPLTSALFQLDGRPGNDFRGGHGFTGLQYALGPSGTEVQWWCTAD